MIYENCPMCGMENIEYFHNREEWKTAMICYGCLYVEVKKRFYIKSKEEEKTLCDLEDKSSLSQSNLSEDPGSNPGQNEGGLKDE